MRLERMFSGYPRYTQQVLKDEVYGPNNDPKELKYFHEFGLKMSPFLAAYMVLGAMLIVKNLFFPIYTLVAVTRLQKQYPRLSGNVLEIYPKVQGSTTSNIISFGCLMTNCTRLSSSPNGRFYDDLLVLPVFKLCFPGMVSIQNPITDSNLIGLIVHSILLYFNIVIGLIAPIFVYVNPINYEVPMFVIAPKTIQRLYGEICRKYLIGRIISFRYYLHLWRTQSSPASSVSIRMRTFERNCIEHESSQLEQLRTDYDLTNEQAKDYINDCIPFIRSDYFVHIQAKKICIYFVACGTYYFTLFLLSAWILQRTNERSNKNLILIDEYIRLTGCAIWRKGSTDDTYEVLRVSEPKIDWTPFTFITFAVQFWTVAYVQIDNFPVSVYSLEELLIQIEEQRYRLQVAIEMTESLTQLGLENLRTGRLSLYNGLTAFKFDQMRSWHNAKLLNSISLRRRKTLKQQVDDGSLEEQARDTKFLREIAHRALTDKGQSLDAYLNVLIKTYISNRALIRLVKRGSQNIKLLLAFCYSLSFGSVLIIIYIIRIFDGKNYAAFIAGLTGLMLTSIILSAAAKVQANSKRLMKQMWRLIAVTRNFKDPRISHMRSLWIKQVIVLSQEGAMSLKAFDIPLTYETVIEFVVWTSTLTVLAFSR